MVDSGPDLVECGSLDPGKATPIQNSKARLEDVNGDSEISGNLQNRMSNGSSQENSESQGVLCNLLRPASHSLRDFSIEEQIPNIITSALCFKPFFLLNSKNPVGKRERDITKVGVCPARYRWK
jgi:hypothetical protein